MHLLTCGNHSRGFGRSAVFLFRTLDLRETGSVFRTRPTNPSIQIIMSQSSTASKANPLTDTQFSHLFRNRMAVTSTTAKRDIAAQNQGCRRNLHLVIKVNSRAAMQPHTGNAISPSPKYLNTRTISALPTATRVDFHPVASILGAKRSFVRSTSNISLPFELFRFWRKSTTSL
jgi:hypothetical protein